MIWWTTGRNEQFTNASLLVIWYARARGPRPVRCNAFVWWLHRSRPTMRTWRKWMDGEWEAMKKGPAARLGSDNCSDLLVRFIIHCAHSLQLWSEVMIPIMAQNLYYMPITHEYLRSMLISSFNVWSLLFFAVPFRSQFIRSQKHFYFLTIKNSNLYLCLIYYVCGLWSPRKMATAIMVHLEIRLSDFIHYGAGDQLGVYARSFN